MITEHQQKVLEELQALNKMGIEPTVRSLTDRLESFKHRSERWTDGEVQGVLTRLKDAGAVESFKDDGNKSRWRAASE